MKKMLSELTAYVSYDDLLNMTLEEIFALYEKFIEGDKTMMKDIKGYEGLYAVTQEGQVWSYQAKKFLSPCDNGQGYMMLTLFDKSGKKKHWRVHRLVAMTFLPNPEGKPIVNHKDENKANNNVNNLEWATHAENIRYSAKRRSKPNRNPIYCVELDKVYKTREEAANEAGIHKQGITNCLRGVQQTAGGYHWRYAEEEEK